MANEEFPKLIIQNAKLKIDLTGWLLDDARTALAGEQITIIETGPPRAAGPLGAWRILRCRFESNSGYQLLVGQEQLPGKAAAD